MNQLLELSLLCCLRGLYWNGSGEGRGWGVGEEGEKSLLFCDVPGREKLKVTLLEEVTDEGDRISGRGAVCGRR